MKQDLSVSRACWGSCWWFPGSVAETFTFRREQAAHHVSKHVKLRWKMWRAEEKPPTEKSCCLFGLFTLRLFICSCWLINTPRGWRSDKINESSLATMLATPTRSAVTILLLETSKKRSKLESWGQDRQTNTCCLWQAATNHNIWQKKRLVSSQPSNVQALYWENITALSWSSFRGYVRECLSKNPAAVWWLHRCYMLQLISRLTINGAAVIWGLSDDCICRYLFISCTECITFMSVFRFISKLLFYLSTSTAQSTLPPCGLRFPCCGTNRGRFYSILLLEKPRVS